LQLYGAVRNIKTPLTCPLHAEDSYQKDDNRDTQAESSDCVNVVHFGTPTSCSDLTGNNEVSDW
jgi:hypothetical protein